MKFMLLINVRDQNLPEAETERMSAAHLGVQKELIASGELVDTNELSEDGARVVRRDREQVLVTDGPYIETNEYVGGYYILDCSGIDRACEVAGRFVEAEWAPIDVRPIPSG